MHMVVYMDGGSQKLSSEFGPGRNHVLSYGVVMNYNDETLELYGAQHVKDAFCGHHELYAFVETIKRARALGVNPKHVSFFTDDAMVCNVNLFYSQRGNLHGSESSLEKLNKYCVEFHDEQLYRDCVEFLKHGRFTKLKGHRRTVENLRCDYLAVHARNWFKGDLSPLVPFDDWMHDGFTYYDRNQELQTWYAPFSDNYQMDSPAALDQLHKEWLANKKAELLAA